KPLPEKRREEKNEGIIENPAGADPCTEEEAWRYADGIMLGLSREGVALWHANRQSGGWTIARNNGSMQPISNWQADLRSSKTWIQTALSRARQANDFQRAGGSNGHQRS